MRTQLRYAISISIAYFTEEFWEKRGKKEKGKRKRERTNWLIKERKSNFIGRQRNHLDKISNI